MRNVPVRRGVARPGACTKHALILIVLVACSNGDASRSDGVDSAAVSTDSALGTLSVARITDADVARFLLVSDSLALRLAEMAAPRARDADVQSLARATMTSAGQSVNQILRLAHANSWVVTDSANVARSAPRLAAADDTAGKAGGTSGSLSGTVSTQDSAGAIGLNAGSVAQGALAGTVRQLQATRERLLVELRRTPRADFDEAFLESRLFSLQQTVNVLRQYSGSVQSAELRSLVQTRLSDSEAQSRRVQVLRARFGTDKPAIVP